MVVRKSRGYTEDPKIRSLRVRAWFQAVTLISGKTAAGLEREFSERRDRIAVPSRSCIWQKYKQGLVEPRNRCRGDGRLNLVERVEKKYPGTAKWLSSPLWRLADKTPMEMSEVRKVFSSLPKLLKSMFIASPEKATGVFWRRPIDCEHAYELLLRLKDVDAFVATLAMIKEAEAIQDQLQHMLGVLAARRYLSALKTHPIVGKSLSGEIADYLESGWESPGYLEDE